MGYKSKFKGSTVDDRVSLIPSLIGEVRSLTYQSLLDLREESKLKPGQLYRITDYVTTTSQTNTQSAGHQFDVIVLALTNDTLAERAWACHHEGDTYFQNSHLEAWQIWYCLDNDTERFAWADATNGKGVIYRMIDEWNNDCPYDFKNIMFNVNNKTFGTNFYYTFCRISTVNAVLDASLSEKVYNNKIEAYYREVDDSQKLNNITFVGSTVECTGNYFGFNCWDIICNINNRYNKFVGDNYDITLAENCAYNVFESGGNIVYLSETCKLNTFGQLVENITLFTGCRENYIGESSIGVTLGADSTNNRIGSFCQNLDLVDDCEKNTFGEKCKDILVDTSDGNSFGNGCSDIEVNGDGNSFGNECSGIKIYGEYNSFGNKCSNIDFTAAQSASNIGYNSFGNGCSEINLNKAGYNSSWFLCNGNSFGNNVDRITFSAIKNAMHIVSGIIVGADSGNFTFVNESTEKYWKLLILPGTRGNDVNYDIDPINSLDSTIIYGCRERGVVSSVYFEKLFQI